MANNLRPYYNPNTFNSPVKGNESIRFVTGTSSGDSSYGGSGIPVARGGFDYLDVDLGGTGDSISGVGISLARLYSKVFVSQPWEVSRLLLQVGQWDERGSERTQRTPSVAVEEEEDEDEEVNYFTAVTGDYNLSREWSGTKNDDEEVVVEKKKKKDSLVVQDEGYPEMIRTISLNFVDIFSALNEKDGFRGLWRGLNTSFIIDALSSTIEAWLSGFFSSISGVPDPHFVEVLHSPNPIVSLGTALCATVLTSVIISPIDMIRTRLAVTTFNSKYPRSIRTSLWQLDGYISSTSVLIPTVLHSGVPNLIRRATPYFLYTRLGVDKFNSPSLYSLLTLFSSLFELGVKLPLETIMRRAHLDSLQLDPQGLIIKPAEYHGVLTTLWNVILGYDSPQALFRGWRVSVVGTIGEWGVNAIQSSEREKERF
jgi:hypothetical protein